MWNNPMGPMGMRPHRRGGLRFYVYWILQQSPKNGAEIIDQIESVSQGWWRPSPGSIYPLLDEMQQEGIIRKRDDGKYELTERSKQGFEWPWGMPTRQPRNVEEMIGEINSYVSYLEDLSKSDKAKITPHLDALKKIRDRLAALLNS